MQGLLPLAPRHPRGMDRMMSEWTKEAETQYAALLGYAENWQRKLLHLLQPYVVVTDLYGTMFCEITLALGQDRPNTPLEPAIRDLMADVFDFLYETRALILKGKLEIAYPLARRAYESLSLMVACDFDSKLAERWISGRKIDNGHVQQILARHPRGESKDNTKELNEFFTKFSHPNRDMMAHRFLGDNNEFVLGAVGKPSLAMLADYALKTLNLWFWFGAFVSFIYFPILSEFNPNFKKSYDEAAKMAQDVARWLSEQFDRTLTQEQAELRTQAAKPTKT